MQKWNNEADQPVSEENTVIQYRELHWGVYLYYERTVLFDFVYGSELSS